MQVLIIAPKSGDYPTKLSYRMLYMVYKDAKRYGLDVSLLEEELANPITLQSFLHFIKPKTKIIIYGGHATPISWVGQWILLHLLAPYGIKKVPGVKGRILAGLPACFDNKTEILTADGFKHFDEITRHDKIATLNPDGFIEYHHPTNIIKYHYNGDMIHFRGQTYDVMVTPNHRMYVKSTYNNTFKFITAEELANKAPRTRCKYEFKRDAKWTGHNIQVVNIPPPGEHYLRAKLYHEAMELKEKYGFGTRIIYKRLRAKYANDMMVSRATISNWITGKHKPWFYEGINLPVDTALRIIAWYIAEGFIREERTVCIARTKEKNVEAIIELFKNAGFSPRYDKKRNTVYVTSKPLAQYLKTMCDKGAKNKRVPFWIKQLPPNKLDLFLQTLMRGNGYTRGTGGVCYTSSETLLDDLTEIGLKAGYAVTYYIDRRKERHDTKFNFEVNYPVYHVSFSKSRNTPRINAIVERVPYNGHVYCVTVPNHVIFIRRNGKTLWVGNCEPAKVLGPLAIKSGAEAFVGSLDYMWAGAGPELPGYKGYDYARDFIDTWYRFHITLLTTRDVDRAYEVYRDTVLGYIEKYENEKPNDWQWHVWALRENLNELRVFKNESL